MHVMVVDDDPTTRSLLMRFLSSWGVSEVIQAADGARALSLLNTACPALILTDRQMPNVDGIELVRTIRSRGLKTPVVMLSGHADAPDVAEALRAGVTRFLAKPVDLMSLRTAFRELAGAIPHAA
ncbi:MAG: response regulator [Tepidisphaeraceae bacterium]